MILVQSMRDQFKGCSQRCYHTEIIRTIIHPKRILSTEKTSEKVVSKKENDTSSNNDNVGKGRLCTTDKTEDSLTGFVAKHQLKARNGTNLLNITIKKHHVVALARRWVLKIKSEKRAVQ